MHTNRDLHEALPEMEMLRELTQEYGEQLPVLSKAAPIFAGQQFDGYALLLQTLDLYLRKYQNLESEYSKPHLLLWQIPLGLLFSFKLLGQEDKYCFFLRTAQHFRYGMKIHFCRIATPL